MQFISKDGKAHGVWDKPDRSKQGKKSRDKGKGFERDVANAFRLAGWLGAKRHLEFQTAEALAARDLDGTEPFTVQCKALQNYVSINTIKTVRSEPGNMPVLVTKADNERACAVLYFDDFLKLVTAMKRAGVDLAPPTEDDF